MLYYKEKAENPIKRVGKTKNNTIMKKLISLCAAFVCAITVSAAIIKDGFVEYVPNFVKHTASITFLDFKEVNQEVYTLPSSVTYEGEEYVVTSISEGALKNGRRNEVCKKIIVPPTIKTIGKAVFRDFSNVKEIVLPPQLDAIQGSTFSLCGSLETIVLPEGIKTIGSNAFQDCRALTSINIPSSVTNIYSQAFERTSIKELALPEGMRVISAQAFYNMRKLQKIVLSSTIMKIEGSAFAYCERLSEIILPSHLQSIGHAAFQGCASLEQINIPSEVESIDAQAFIGCSELKQISFPGRLRLIGRESFLNCANLESVSFSGAIPPIISFSAFDYTRLYKVYVPKGCAARYKATGDGSYRPFENINITETDNDPDIFLMLAIVENRHKKILAYEGSKEETLIVQKYAELYNFLSPDISSADKVQKIYHIQTLFYNNSFQTIKKPLSKELKSAKTPENIMVAFEKYL